jgi:hypothetical protein
MGGGEVNQQEISPLMLTWAKGEETKSKLDGLKTLPLS